MNEKALPWHVPDNGVGFSKDGYPLTIATALGLEGVSEDEARYLRLLPWPSVHRDIEAMVDRLSRVSFVSDARDLGATVLFNIPEWSVLPRALAELEAYDIWYKLYKGTWDAQDRERIFGAPVHPDVHRLRTGRESSTRSPLEFGPFADRGVDPLGDTVRPKSIEHLSWSQFEFMYGVWQRMTEEFGTRKSVELWCACFDVSDDYLHFVRKLGQRLEVQGSTVMNERQTAGIEAFKKLKRTRKIYSPNRPERTLLSGEPSYYDGWNYVCVKDYQARVKDVGMMGLSFNWECALSPAEILQACEGSSARVKPCEAMEDECPAIAYVLCEEPEAKALLRHGWSTSNFMVAIPEELHEAEAESGPLKGEGPWYMFFGA